MADHNLFVITPLPNPVQRANGIQDHSVLAAALQEATDLAVTAARRMTPDTLAPVPTELHLGARTNRFIQGNLDSPSETYAGVPKEDRPPASALIWRAESGLAPQNLPANLLLDSWSRADILARMALHPDYRPTLLQPRLQPDMLITPDGRLRHQLGPIDHDVFEDQTPGLVAAALLGGPPDQAFDHAKAPLRELENALFRIDYLRSLAQNPQNLVISMLWRTAGPG